MKISVQSAVRSWIEVQAENGGSCGFIGFFGALKSSPVYKTSSLEITDSHHIHDFIFCELCVVTQGR